MATFAGLSEKVKKTFWQQMLEGWGAEVASTLSMLTPQQFTVSSVQVVTNDDDEVPGIADETLINYPVTGTDGELYMGMPRVDAWKLLELAVGESGQEMPTHFEELHQSVLSEAARQMADGLATKVGERLEEPPDFTVGGLVEEMAEMAFMAGCQMLRACVTVAYQTEGGGSDSLRVLLSMPSAFVLRVEKAAERAGAGARPVNRVVEAPTLPIDTTPAAPPGDEDDEPQERPQSIPRAASPFPQITTRPSTHGGNVEAFLDVPLQLTVVLGRSRIHLKDLLRVGPGALVELDTMAGEPMEVIVNGKLIGHGEVIVMDDRFGLKIIDVVEASQRMGGAGA